MPYHSPCLHVCEDRRGCGRSVPSYYEAQYQHVVWTPSDTSASGAHARNS